MEWKTPLGRRTFSPPLGVQSAPHLIVLLSSTCTAPAFTVICWPLKDWRGGRQCSVRRGGDLSTDAVPWSPGSPGLVPLVLFPYDGDKQGRWQSTQSKMREAKKRSEKAISQLIPCSWPLQLWAAICLSLHLLSPQVSCRFCISSSVLLISLWLSPDLPLALGISRLGSWESQQPIGSPTPQVAGSAHL